MRYFLTALALLVVWLAVPALAAGFTPRVDHLDSIASTVYPGADERCVRELGHPVRLVRYGELTLPPNAEGHSALADAPYEICVTRIAEGALTLSRRDLCALLVHERGHQDRDAAAREGRSRYVYGDHSHDRYSIMFGGYLAVDRVPACNRLGWAEEKIAALVDRAADLRAARRGGSARYRRSAIRRLRSVKFRAAALRRELGP